VREFSKGTTGLQVAESNQLTTGQEVLAITVNEQIWDLSRPIDTDATIKLHKWDDEEAKHAYWHSSAHLMAEALQELYPGIKFGIGPAIENGFYYDVDPGTAVIKEADLPVIEAKMQNLQHARNPLFVTTLAKPTRLKCSKPKVTNTKWNLSAIWLMEPLRCIRRVTLPTFVADLTCPTPPR
jgi:threonyl-tRNA synthetase